MDYVEGVEVIYTVLDLLEAVLLVEGTPSVKTVGKSLHISLETKSGDSSTFCHTTEVASHVLVLVLHQDLADSGFPEQKLTQRI